MVSLYVEYGEMNQWSGSDLYKMQIYCICAEILVVSILEIQIGVGARVGVRRKTQCFR